MSQAVVVALAVLGSLLAVAAVYGPYAYALARVRQDTKRKACARATQQPGAPARSKRKLLKLGIPAAVILAAVGTAVLGLTPVLIAIGSLFGGVAAHGIFRLMYGRPRDSRPDGTQ